MAKKPLSLAGTLSKPSPPIPQRGATAPAPAAKPAKVPVHANLSLRIYDTPADRARYDQLREIAFREHRPVHALLLEAIDAWLAARKPS